jgi:hypothetical protein
MKTTIGKKKILVGCISVLLIAGLAGCTSSANTGETTATVETVNTELSKETVVVKTSELTYPLVDTNQGLCYDDSELIESPKKGEDFYGQDAQYTGNVPSYIDNGDGTVTDTVTGLIWTQELSDYSMVYSEAEGYAESLTTGGITDWRVPTLKELWSIRDFSQGWPWLDTDYFHLVGDGSQGAQQHSWSSNYYLVDTDEAKKDIAFVVNDWTGHIKAMDGKRFVRCVSGEPYGINEYKDNSDGTVTDVATDLMWAQDDSGMAMNWKDALAYAENSEYGGYDDWRLPNAKELQSIVDYSGVFPTLDTSVFNISQIVNEAGNADYPYFWTSTSNPYIDPHDENGYWYAWYVAFGYAVGTDGQDLHGAGAVRFDTKHEEGADGPDGERYYNYVRLVRGGGVVETPEGDPATVKTDRIVVFEDGETGMPTARANGPKDSSESSVGGHPDGPSSEMKQGGPDLAAAAKVLGISETVLIQAMGDQKQGPPDFAAIAKTLGITEAELLKALGISEGGNPRPAERT